MKFKRFVSGTAALVLAAGFAGVPGIAQITGVDTSLTASADTLTFGDFKYTSSDTGVTITKYTGTGTEIVIPSEIDGKPVTVIGDSAFSSRSTITSLTIPDSVTSLENWAFGNCVNLTGINIPDGVTYIGDYAFSRCLKLTSIDIPRNVSTLGENLFFNCNTLESINVDPDNSYYCSSDGVVYDKTMTQLLLSPKAKKNVTIPDGVAVIGEKAFSDSFVESVTIPDSVMVIEKEAFYNCTKLTDLNIPNSVIHIKDKAFCDCVRLTSVSIPDSVIFIGGSAFSGGRSLTSVTLPDSDIAIGDNAFYECRALKSVTVPKSITSIGKQAFGYYYYGTWIDPYHEGPRPINGFKLYCYKDTAGEQYAKDNNVAYEIISDTDPAAGHPKITSTEYSEEFHRFRVTWNRIRNAQAYGIAVKLSGKWKVINQNIPADTTTFTSPKLRPGSTYEIVVCARFGGKWDISNLNGRAVKITVR